MTYYDDQFYDREWSWQMQLDRDEEEEYFILRHTTNRYPWMKQPTPLAEQDENPT